LSFHEIALTTLLAIPSLYLIEKYLGLAAVPIYLAYVALLVWLWQTKVVRKAAPGMGERTARILTIATLLGLIALFAVLRPLAGSGRFGPGSDADDALNKAVHALFRGEFPYAQKTFLGNPITPMPGELLLAAPFVLLGDGAWQIFLWLPLAFLLARKALGSTAWALTFSWLVLLACPAVLHHLVTGSDYAANSISVLVLALLVTESASWPSAIFAVLLGVAISSRANFLLLLPIVAGRLVATRGATRGLGLTALAAVAFFALTLPFYLHDPAAFSPLQSAGKLRLLESILPHASWLIPIAGALLSLLFALPKLNRSRATFLRNATAVLAFTLLVPAILWTAIGTPRFQYTSYAELLLYFGLAWVLETDRAPEPTRARGARA
jgi:hypothetical protein